MRFKTQYLYTQEENDLRGKLFTEYFINWILKDPNNVNNNTETRKIKYKTTELYISELFTKKTLNVGYENNPIFINFLENTAIYHAIIGAGNLQNNKYSLNLYKFLYENFNNFYESTQKIYLMFFKLYVKEPSGVYIQKGFTTKIMDLSDAIFIVNHKAFKRFIIKEYKNIYLRQFNIATNTLRINIGELNNLYNKLKINTFYDEYLYQWKINYMFDKDKLKINNCNGLYLKDVMCLELIDNLSNVNKKNLINYLEKYLDVKYNSDWSNATRNIKNIDKKTIHKIFNLLNIRHDLSLGYGYENWYNNHIKLLYNEKIINMIKNNEYFLNFIKKLIEYAEQNSIMVEYDTYDAHELFDAYDKYNRNSWIDKNMGFIINLDNKKDNFIDHINITSSNMYDLLYALFIADGSEKYIKIE